MNIRIIREQLLNNIDVHGGGYSTNSITVTIDESLDPRSQRNIVINEVVEAFCRTFAKETVDELVDLLVDALDQLD